MTIVRYIDLTCTNVTLISQKKLIIWFFLKKLKLNFLQRNYIFINTWTWMIFYKAVVET